ncbi:MAG: LysR family transcriptional regulator [Eubacterium sp.]|nr:LysR family transcriptional regulator [Eubacterium sp.]
MLTEQMIRCFLTVANNESFTKAAEEMFLTQQAVSKHIKKLEEELSAELFKRSTRSVELTETGEHFYQMFLKWSVEYDSMLQSIDKKTDDNTIRIGMISRMNSGSVPMAANAFKKKHKECKITFIHNEAVDLNRKIADDEINLMITYEQLMPRDKGFRSKKIGETNLLLCLSENHEKVKKNFKLSDMEGEAFLVCLNKGESKSQAMKKAVESRKRLGLGEGEIRLYSDIDEVNMMTELGEGFSFCSDSNLFASNPFIKTYPLAHKTVICACWKTNNNNKLLKEFINCIPG